MKNHPTVTAAQSEILTVDRVTKPANKAQWLVFTMTHPDWTENINLVAITEGMGVEYDESIYNFEGVQYKPVSMSVTLPSETADDNGKVVVSFARAGSEAKQRMKEITPANARTPKTFVFKRYYEGVLTPVEQFSGYIAIDYPKISGQDVQIEADLFNPSLLTNRQISTLDVFPELRNS